MADSVVILQQKLEFLQLELDDSKTRELRLQQLYDTLLASMSSPQPTESVDSGAIEQRHRSELEKVSEDARVKVREAQDQLRHIQDIHRECEFSLRTQKLSYEETILELKQQIYQLNNDKSHLTMKIKSQTSELDKLRKSHEESQTAHSAQSQKVFEELKEMYENDKKLLAEQIEKLQRELKYQKDVVHTEMDQNYSTLLQERMDALFQQSQEELDEVRREKELSETKNAALEQEINSIKEELRHSTTKNEQQKLFIHERMEKTKKLLEFASNTNEEMKKLKAQGNERSWKEIITEKEQALSAKNAEVNELNVKVAQLTLQIDDMNSGLKDKQGQMGCEEEIQELMDEMNRLRSQLAEKDSMVSRLKKQIGDQKVKRPSRVTSGSPKHDHSFSLTSAAPEIGSPKAFEELTYPGSRGNSGFFEQVPIEDLKIMRICQKMVNAAASLECEFCRHIIATQAFPEHIKTCQSDSLEVSAIIPSIGAKDMRAGSEIMDPKSHDARVEELERANYELRISLGELRNERDKAKLECEKLLIQLKHVKLEWAMAEERTADKDLELKRQIKIVLDGLIGLQALLEEGSEVYKMLDDLCDRTRECLSRGFRSKSRTGMTSPKNQMAET